MNELGVFFDTETCGFPDWSAPSDAPQQPHLVQIAAHVVNMETRKRIQSMDVIIKPDGWEIPGESTEIHGITTEFANSVGVSEELAIRMFFEMWLKCGSRIAHNTPFDNRIVRIALKRYFGDKACEAWKAGPYECTGKLSTPIMKMPFPSGKAGMKMPKMIEAYEHFTGKRMKGAHTAIGDVNACMAVYWAVQDFKGE